MISVIVPLYNSAKYIRDCLDSVINQTYTNWECIVIDDGSTDNSKDIILEYCNSDYRIKYYYQVNSGPSKARNYGFQISKGDFIQYLDADDVLLPNRFEVMLEIYKNEKKNIIFYSNYLIGNDSNIYDTRTLNRQAHIGIDITFNDMYKRFALDFLIIPSCSLFPKRAIIDTKWNEDLAHSEDWDYYLNILKNNYVMRYLDDTLLIYRNSSESLSKNIDGTLLSNYKILYKWKNNDNYFTFIKRSALLFKKSIILYKNKKSRVIIKPVYKNINIFKLTLWLIYLYTIYYLIIDIFILIYKKLKYFIYRNRKYI